MVQLKALADLSVRQGDTDTFLEIPAGTITNQIPDVSVDWLIEQGYAERAEPAQEAAPEPAPEAAPVQAPETGGQL